jgi:dCMP deaminase
MMMLAIMTAHGSTCSRRAVGCVLTNRDGKVIATGYNGAPSGFSHCIDDGCVTYEGHCIQCLHAELNACLQASEDVDAAFCTDEPCINCLKALIQKGVRFIYYWRDYDDPIRDMFVEKNQVVSFRKVTKLVYSEVWNLIEKL